MKAKGDWFHPKEGWVQAGKGWNVWFLPFGLIGPIIGSMIWLVVIIAGLWALSFANAVLQSQFISLLIGAVGRNLHWFFAVSLITGYLDFLSRKFPPAFPITWPASNAVGITFSAWIISWLFRTIGAMANVAVLSQIGIFLKENLAGIFVLFFAMGLLLVLAKVITRRF